MFVIPGIIHLGLVRSPAAIGLAIRTIVVYAVDCVSFWAFTHIGKKVFKFKPAPTNPNPSASVIGKRLTVWIVTALQYRAPYHVNSGVAHAMRDLSLQAIRAWSTLFRKSSTKIAGLASTNVSAHATAFPHGPFPLRWKPFENSPISEDTPSKIDEVWHENKVTVRYRVVKGLK